MLIADDNALRRQTYFRCLCGNAKLAALIISHREQPDGTDKTNAGHAQNDRHDIRREEVAPERPTVSILAADQRIDEVKQTRVDSLTHAFSVFARRRAQPDFGLHPLIQRLLDIQHRRYQPAVVKITDNAVTDIAGKLKAF